MTSSPTNPWDFAGKLAIVTGAGRGLGRAIAESLAAHGAEVHGFDRDAASDLPFPLHPVDIADPAAIRGAVAALPHPCAILVNNAGITRDRTLAKMSEDEWRSVIDVNLGGAFHMLQAVLPGMTAAGWGRVVNITSINGLRGKFGQGNYTAAKAGMIGLTKTAARELGPKGVTVNCIAPGLVLTDMALALPQALLDKALDETALKRLARPEDIANAALFLCSDAARMITGMVLKVDAGQYL